MFVGECANSGALGIMVGSRLGGSVQRVLSVALDQRDFWLVWFRLRNGREGLLFSAQSGDSTNIFRVSLDGTRQRVTSGTGFETAAAVSPAGDVIFTHAESNTSIRSM